MEPEDIEGLKMLRSRTSVPIATGERLLTKWAFAPLLEQRLIDVAQPDPAHAGGITEVRKIAALAEAHHVFVQPHNPYGPMNTLAAAHLNAALPNFLIMELIMEAGMHEWFGDVVFGDFPTLSDGHMSLPTGPGLGCSINEEAIAAYPPNPEAFPSSYLRRAPIKPRQGAIW